MKDPLPRPMARSRSSVSSDSAMKRFFDLWTTRAAAWMAPSVIGRVRYTEEVDNGDSGVGWGIDLENQTLSITFDGRDVDFDFGELDLVTLEEAQRRIRTNWTTALP